MKAFTKILAIAAIATGGLWASQASAAFITNQLYTGNNYLGVYDPNANDSALFGNPTLGVGAFVNTWFFRIDPAGAASVNANFIPGAPNPLSITGFQVELFNASGACGAIGSDCGMTGTVGSSIGVGMPGLNSSNIGFTGLAAGLYAFQVSGTVVSVPTLYSGQLVTQAVPEPGSLALLGLGLLGLGAARRRKV